VSRGGGSSISWTPRTASPFTGDAYGYGWFLRQDAGPRMEHDLNTFGVWRADALHRAVLELTVVMTSTRQSRRAHRLSRRAQRLDGADDRARSRDTRARQRSAGQRPLHAFLAREVCRR
jgi:hypothetical protein